MRTCMDDGAVYKFLQADATVMAVIFEVEVLFCVLQIVHSQTFVVFSIFLFDGNLFTARHEMDSQADASRSNLLLAA